jgi:hypothetical protein
MDLQKLRIDDPLFAPFNFTFSMLSYMDATPRL